MKTKIGKILQEKLHHRRVCHWVCLGIIAVVIGITAIFLLWWKGCLLPRWIVWEEKSFPYEDARVTLEKGRLELEGLWRTPWDWSVQDVLCDDINGDGKEELVLLVWKHGSYGKHLPFWVKHNDIRLEQHVFIYQWEESRENKLRALWMSSALGMEVQSIASAPHHQLLITGRDGVGNLWQWQQFGLKYVGEAKEQRVTFLCAGDNLIHPQLLRHGTKDYSYLYEQIKEEVQQADFASINQETIFVKDRGLVSGFPRFGTPIQVGDAIIDAGFNIVTLANNHVLDKGSYGVDVTARFYEEKGITYLGAHPTFQEDTEPQDTVTFVEKNGLRIALLNYTYGTNGQPMPEGYPHMVERLEDRERMDIQLETARTQADAVVVFVHWGTEYDAEPDEQQEEYTRYFLEKGVDVVVGTHPHVVQPYEIVQDDNGHEMLVYYSLGNLVSAQEPEECKTGGLAKFALVKKEEGSVSIEDYSLEPVTIDLLTE